MPLSHIAVKKYLLSLFRQAPKGLPIAVINAYKNTFDAKDGRLVLIDLMAQFASNTQPKIENVTCPSSYVLGQMHVIHYIQDKITTDPNLMYATMADISSYHSPDEV